MSQIIVVGDENGMGLMTRVRVAYTYLFEQLALIVQRGGREMWTCGCG